MNQIVSLSQFSLPPGVEPFYEVVNGQRLETPPMSAFENIIASRALYYLYLFAEQSALGQAVMETLFLFDRQTNKQRRPDVAFVSYQRWPKGRRVPRTDPWDVVPNLAIEVNSHTNTFDQILAKIREYFQAGVERVWVVCPSEELVYVYQSPTQNKILTRADELDGETVLPGFHLPLATLFGDAEEESAQVNG